MIKRLYMTLLETLIAFSLLSFLLVGVFGFFREISFINQLTEKTQKATFSMRYLDSRLSYIFARIVNESASARKFFFYTQPAQPEISDSPSLIFTFDNGVRKNPYFSGDILARLYVDKAHQLHLTTWPLRIERPQEHMYDEILIENVESLRFFFYSPPASQTEVVTNTQNHEEGAEETEGATTAVPHQTPTQPNSQTWYEDEWLFAYRQMPGILKIVIKLANDANHSKNDEELSLNFSFVLPSSKHPIQYFSNRPAET